jgi:hypothetical protein
MSRQNYKTMRAIGAEVGLTSHKIGKALKETGYRDLQGKPSDKAFSEELVKDLPSTQPGTYIWGWDSDRTISILKENGYV